MPVKETPAHNNPAVSVGAKSAELASAAGDAQGTWQPDPTAAAASRGELQRQGKPSDQLHEQFGLGRIC